MAITVENIIVNEIGSVYTYSSDRKTWKTAPRNYHCIAYQMSGHYEHNFNGYETVLKSDTLAFINRNDPYTVKNLETGTSICVTFSADTDMRTVTFDCCDDPRVLNMFKKLLHFENLEKSGNYYHVLSCIYEIMAVIVEKHEKEYLSRDSQDMLGTVHRYILANYREKHISSAKLADMCGITPKYFRTLFKKRYGSPPTQYIIDLKLKKAAEMLSEGGFSVSEAAAAAGFSDICYFSKLFKKRFLCTPREFGKE